MKICCTALKVALLILRSRRSSSKVCAVKQSQPESARAQLRLTKKCVGDFSPINILDASNEIHLFCLHVVYIPLIRQHLFDFVNGWNNHKLSTESNKTPLQLWVRGMLDMANSDHRVAREFREPTTEVSMPLIRTDPLCRKNTLIMLHLTISRRRRGDYKPIFTEPKAK